MTYLIHIYDAPPVTGMVALCGHVRASDDEAHRLHRSDNECGVCAVVAGAERRVLVARTPLIEDPRVWVRVPASQWDGHP